jgi:tyrosine-protein kinase Etk/Wzc
MTEPTMDAPETQAPGAASPAGAAAQRRSGLVDILLVLGRWKRFILLNVIIVTGLAAAASFMLPRVYKSTATVMPPKNTSPLSLFGLSSSSLARQFNPLSALSGGLSPNLYTFVAVLKSQSMLLRMVREFDLQREYDAETPEDAASTLKGLMDYMVNEEGTITLEVYDRDPQRVYRMMTFLTRVVDSLNRDLSVREAANNRAFLEQRVNRNLEDMAAAEEELKTFQEQHGVVALSSEAAASANAVAEVYAQKMLKELEVGYLERAMGADNPQLQASRMQLAELDKQTRGYPDMGLRYFRLYRTFTIQQKLYETLLPLYEQARIEEHRNTPTLLVLDAASVPKRPALPKKKLIVLVFFALSLIFSMSIALIIDGLRRRVAAQPARYRELAEAFRFRRRR